MLPGRAMPACSYGHLAVKAALSRKFPAKDDRREARQSMLDAYPSLQKMYSADDGNTEVFYFKNATATFSSFTHEPEVVKF